MFLEFSNQNGLHTIMQTYLKTKDQNVFTIVDLNFVQGEQITELANLKDEEINKKQIEVICQNYSLKCETKTSDEVETVCDFLQEIISNNTENFTGQVKFITSSNIIEGVGTLFNSELSNGDIITIHHESLVNEIKVEVISVLDDSSFESNLISASDSTATYTPSNDGISFDDIGAFGFNFDVPYNATKVVN